jgi:hypothetical protein
MQVSFKHCKIYTQVTLAVYFLVSLSCFAETSSRISRAPANFVPDDDMIIVPVVIEKNMMDEFHDKHEKDFRAAKKKLQHWITQEQYAKDYGLENTGIVSLPTEEEKQRFLQKHYLRFISKDVERSTNSSLQDTLDDWTADDEIDSIKAVELHEKVLVKAQSRKGKPELKAVKNVKVGKDNFKFGFQVRPEIGMMKFTLKSKYFYARGWIGVNGNQEINLEKKFKSTGTSSFVNYYIDETKLLAAIDQHLVGHWSLRATHSKDFDDLNHFNDTIVTEDNILQLRFSMGF